MKLRLTVIFCFLLLTDLLQSQSVISSDQIVNFNLPDLRYQLNDRNNPMITFAQLPHLGSFQLQKNNTLANDDLYKDYLTYFILNGSQVVGSFTLAPDVFYFDYMHLGKSISISPNYNTDTREDYVVSYERKPIPFGFCATDHTGLSEDISRSGLKLDRSVLASKREYRIAIVATGEFYQANGGSPASSRAAIVASVNGISAIYAKQFSIFIKLIGDFSYPDPNTDPFVPNLISEDRPQQAAVQVPVSFPNSNSYDIGHVLHKHTNGDNWGTGGIARLSSVCDNSPSGGGITKAAGWSGSFRNSGPDWYSLFAHEIGHQFSMTHTFNGTGSNCTDAISLTTAVEIGSGTTIMSYNGICDANQNTPSNGEADNYFHYQSALQIGQYISTEIPSCANPVPTTNNFPVINPFCVNTFKLPKTTPYYLKGSATDADGDIIYYSWDQFDEDGPNGKTTQGLLGSAAGNRKNSPLMKCNPPSLNNERYFPDIATVAKGNTSDVFQALANTDRQINFAFSARDDKATGGATSYLPIKLDVAATGPLAVVYPNSGENLNAGQLIKMKWNPNGSDDLCQKVIIKLSIDGGLSYPYTLASNINYGDDSTDITIPGFITNTSTARIMVSCDDFDCFKFFDISNSNFTINSVCNAPASIVCPSDNLSYDKGAPQLDLTLQFKEGNKVNSMQKRITTSSAVIQTPVFNPSFTGCAQIGDSYSGMTKFSVSKTGSYTFSVDPEYQNGFGFVSIVRETGFNGNSPCSSFVSSSGIDAGGGNVSATGSMIATLMQCENYIMLFYNFENKPKTTLITSISGPGIVIEKPDNPTPNFTYTYIAVRKANNIVALVSDVADFRALSPGKYDIYGVMTKNGGASPPNNTNMNNYLGKTFNSFYLQDDCFRSSLNSFELEIKGSCNLESATLLGSGDCDPMNNNFIQDIIIKYTSNSSQLNLGGKLFTVNAGGLDTIRFVTMSTGLSENIDVYFTDEPTCIFPLNILTKPNCCPFTIGVDSIVRGCEGVAKTITANQGLGNYTWLNSSNIVISTSNVLTTSIADTYTLKVSSLTGCEKTQRVKVEFESTPTVSLPSDRTICDGVDFLIDATTNASFLQWFKNDTLVQSGPNKSLKVNALGKYIVRVGNSPQCQVEDDIVISVKPSPKPKLGNDKDICEGQSTTLSITDNGTISWFKDNAVISGQTSKTLTVTESGIYKVVVKAANDCQNEDIINVVVIDLPIINAGPDIKYCKGKNGTVVAESNTLAFQWFKNNVAYPETELNFVVNTPGIYKLVAINSIGCKIADSLVVTENPIPSFDLGLDKVGCISGGTNSDVMLNGPSGTGLKYQWLRNGSNLATTKDVTVNVLALYTLVVTDANGCSNIDTIRVDYKPGPSVVLNDNEIDICEGESFDLIAITTASKIQWLKDGTLINNQTSKTLKVTAAGVYTIKASGGNGSSDCVVEQMATVKVNPKLKVDIKDTTACEGQTLTIVSNVTANKYSWFLDGEIVEVNKTFKPTTGGTYTLEVTTQLGCTSSDQFVVTLSQRPAVSIPATAQYCKGDKVIVNANSNGTAFKWLKNGTAIQNQTTKTLEINAPGVYVIEASFAGNCPRKDTVVVVEKALPLVNLGSDKSLCPGDSILLDAGNSGATYKWSDGSTSKTFKILNVGGASVKKIDVEVKDTNGCIGKDDITVTTIPKIKLQLQASATGICNGDSLTLTASGGTTYQWSGDLSSAIVSEASILVFPSQETKYTVRSGDEICANNFDTISKVVKIFPKIEVSGGNDTCVILGRSVVIKASGGASYQWDADPTIVKGANSASLEVNPEEPNTYFVTIKDKNGCITLDSVNVCIIEDPLKLIKKIEVITPNGDGANDDLKFEGLEAFPENSLIVYNRWGNIIFEKNGYQTDSERFDGTRTGEDLPADTYYYVLKFDQYVYKSSITIIRPK